MIIPPENVRPVKKNNTPKVFDFIYDPDGAFITNYRHLNKEIEILSDGSGLKLSESEMKRVKIKDIEKLRIALIGIISSAEYLLSRNSQGILLTPSRKRYVFTDFKDLSSNLLVDQLVFDILVDKYGCESVPMTLNAYSRNMTAFLGNETTPTNRIDERMRKNIEDFFERINRADSQEQLEKLGVNLNECYRYFAPKRNPFPKKEEFVWDTFYFNTDINITKKQFKRRFTRSNRNYSYEAIFNDFKEFHDFVEKLLPPQNESPRKFFERSMRYYLLESYKRIDFIFKLIETLPQRICDEIHQEHFLIKRFVPKVLVPKELDGELVFGTASKFYRPLFIIEYKILQKIRNDPEPDLAEYEWLLCRYQYVRAKSYELFYYHFQFESTDYNEIKKFLNESYNMRLYHNSNEVWKSFSGKDWKPPEGEKRKQLIELVQRCMSINNKAFFWPLPNIESAQK